jgi:hypothetical protein
LSDDYISYWPEIQKLANSDSPEDFEKLKKYALEGLRLATPAFGLLRGKLALFSKHFILIKYAI